jgi:hypothetical protein
VAAILANLRQHVAELAERPDKLMIAQGLSDCLAGMAFGAAFNMPHDWLTIDRRNQRDGALLRLRTVCFPDMSDRAAAKAAWKVISRYRDSGWRWDQPEHHRPDGRAGFYYDVLVHGDPPGWEQIRRIFIGPPG